MSFFEFKVDPRVPPGEVWLTPPGWMEQFESNPTAALNYLLDHPMEFARITKFTVGPDDPTLRAANNGLPGNGAYGGPKLMGSILKRYKDPNV